MNFSPWNRASDWLYLIDEWDSEEWGWNAHGKRGRDNINKCNWQPWASLSRSLSRSSHWSWTWDRSLPPRCSVWPGCHVHHPHVLLNLYVPPAPVNNSWRGNPAHQLVHPNELDPILNLPSRSGQTDDHIYLKRAKLSKWAGKKTTAIDDAQDGAINSLLVV
jgi:hypothetical protein